MQKHWILWLDDIREPIAEEEKGFKVWCAKSVKDAKWLVEKLGPPNYMYLDHDLGPDETSMDFLKWLAREHPVCAPDYYIISANPIGAKNIKSFMETWKRCTSIIESQNNTYWKVPSDDNQ